jgi:hypothetical protein
VSDRRRCHMRQVVARAVLMLSFAVAIVEGGLKW